MAVDETSIRIAGDGDDDLGGTGAALSGVGGVAANGSGELKGVLVASAGVFETVPAPGPFVEAVVIAAAAVVVFVAVGVGA
jgi:hypothetical protein